MAFLLVQREPVVLARLLPGGWPGPDANRLAVPAVLDAGDARSADSPTPARATSNRWPARPGRLRRGDPGGDGRHLAGVGRRPGRPHPDRSLHPPARTLLVR